MAVAENNSRIPTITALLVMGPDRRAELLLQLEAAGIEALPVNDCRAAHDVFEAHRPVHVVLTDTVLPDGDWRSVIGEAGRRPLKPAVVVCFRLPDSRLWIDILEEGAYDVIVEPYKREEVRRIVEAAALRSRSGLQPTSAPSQPALVNVVTGQAE